MNCESCDDPKNSRMAAITGFALIRSCGIAVAISLVDRHLFLDRALHTDQTDAELVLEELADRADAAVAQVVDVVDILRVLAQLELVLEHLVEVLRVQNLLIERRLQPELGVQLQPADPREVVLLRIEEHVLEERP